ncbi:hypothetical protein BHE74_00048316 [Ensete ventricosum]|nr:hypothetical protein GW17_00023332 [Ensete ventricosum]RWW45807.1 hypothetical protein BHE74_00048316 [Ensete ventricosum]RZS21825.1 hypothetical protein BHM03_00054527 [Ensete ventricosum]
MNEVADVIIDIECLTQPPEICCSGSPKMSQKALLRKGSIRMERHTGGEQEAYDALKNLVKAVPSHTEQLKQPPVPFKTPQAVQSAPNCPAFSDLGEGRTKRLNHLTTIHPWKFLLVFAAMSSIGTMVLIYLTLAIRRVDGA